MILLGVSGSIAAYKAAELASRLTQAGHQVTVVMTRAAQELVTPATFLNLTGNRVYTDLWQAEGQTEHIALTDRADLVIVAPATANTLARLAHGLADEVLSTTLLAVRCPVLVCPAMNTRMWQNPVVQRNLALVRAQGHRVLSPEEGHLACGHTGPGRLPEPTAILAAAEELLAAGAAARAVEGAPGYYFEILALEEPPSDELLAEEQRYRAPAQQAGELLACGKLGSSGSHRYGYLHRVESLEVAMKRARSAPLSQHRSRIEVYPWKLDGGSLLP